MLIICRSFLDYNGLTLVTPCGVGQDWGLAKMNELRVADGNLSQHDSRNRTPTTRTPATRKYMLHGHPPQVDIACLTATTGLRSFRRVAVDA